MQLTKEALNKSDLSFPRRREPSQFKALDSRLRGNDDLISASPNISETLVRLDVDRVLAMIGEVDAKIAETLRGREKPCL